MELTNRDIAAIKRAAEGLYDIETMLKDATVRIREYRTELEASMNNPGNERSDIANYAAILCNLVPMSIGNVTGNIPQKMEYLARVVLTLASDPRN